MIPKLIPAGSGLSQPLGDRVTVVGRRKRTCGICLDDLRVSRVHCVIRRTDDGGFELRDLGSTNGTRVNGTRVTECTLMHNDELAFARERFRLTLRAASLASRSVDSSESPLDSSADEEASGDDNRGQIKLTRSKQHQLEHVLHDTAATGMPDESATEVIPRVESLVEPNRRPDSDEEPTVIQSEAQPRPSIHPCPHCTQSYMQASAFRWWELPLKVLMIRPFQCPRCSERFMRLNL